MMKQIIENLEWIADSDPSVDLQRAMNLLQAELAT
jgi:hypothetical protein